MEMYEEWLQATSQTASTDEIRHQRSVEKKEEKGSSPTELKKKHHKSDRDRSRSPRREHGKKHKKHKRKDRSNSPERSKRSKKHKRSRE